MNKPQPSEYDPYYETYVSLVNETNIADVLAAQTAELKELISPLPESKGEYRYADGKWSIKEVLGHLIDGERMFAYRILRVSRGDETPIEGFEQDGYIENAHSNDRTFGDLLEEFDLLRRANLLMLKMYDDAAWQRIGTANNVKISARALAYIMAGHIRHHISILQSRYLA